MADPMLAKIPKESGGVSGGSDLRELPPSANPNTTSPTIAAILNNMKTLCTLLPARAPKQLMRPCHRSASREAVPIHTQTLLQDGMPREDRHIGRPTQRADERQIQPR